MTTATKRLRRSGLAGLAALATVGGALAVTAGSAGATSTATVNRISGPDRYATAATLAGKAFPNGATNVIIASGAAAHFADALSGNYLAGQLNAPILLTSSTGAMPTSTMTEITGTLKPTNIYILGDSNAVPTAQETALTTAGYKVTRLAGTDRYQTNLKVLQAGGSAGTVGGTTTAVVASGANFPDALSAGALAYADKLPVILTDPTNISSQVATAISSLGIKQVIIMGSTASVSAADETAIHTDGATTLQRFAGTDRANTSQLLAEWEIANVGFSNSTFTVATGDQTLSGADALAAGPFAGSTSTPILVTDTIANAGSVVAFATAHAATESTVNILGTTNSVSAAAESAITTAVKSSVGAVTALPQLLSAAITGTVTAGQANANNPAGTTVKYTFSHNVLTAAAGDFLVYDSADTTNGTVGTSATVSGNTVSVLFSTINTTSGGGATDASQLSLATVVNGAVTDGSGKQNPEGAAAVGTSSSSTTVATAGTTTAPDLRSVGRFGLASAANSTAVDFTFDQSATTLVPAGFQLLATDGVTIVTCTGPAVGDTTFGSGGTLAGGNGTVTITAICPDNANTGGATTTIVPGDIARGWVLAGTVKGTDSAAASNQFESANVTGVSLAPDLKSATFIPAGTGSNSTTNDEVIYTFDQTIGNAPVAAKFHVVTSTGTVNNGASIQQQSTDGTQVVVNFAKGSLTNAVLATVDAAAGTGVQAASVSVAPISTSTTSIVPGTVNAVQLAAVKIVKSTDVLGNASYTAQYTFTAAVNGTPADIVPADFHLYNAAGANWPATTCAIDSSSNKQVDCTAFTLPAGTTDISGGVLGTVEDGAVIGDTAASTNAAPSTNPNPEGAANVS